MRRPWGGRGAPRQRHPATRLARSGLPAPACASKARPGAHNALAWARYTPCRAGGPRAAAQRAPWLRSPGVAMRAGLGGTPRACVQLSQLPNSSTFLSSSHASGQRMRVLSSTVSLTASSAAGGEATRTALAGAAAGGGVGGGTTRTACANTASGAVMYSMPRSSALSMQTMDIGINTAGSAASEDAASRSADAAAAAADAAFPVARGGDTGARPPRRTACGRSRWRGQFGACTARGAGDASAVPQRAAMPAPSMTARGRRERLDGPRPRRESRPFLVKLTRTVSRLLTWPSCAGLAIARRRS